MRRFAALRAISEMIGDVPVVTNVGPIRTDWEFIRPSDGNLYQAGLGLVVPVALGLALGLRPEPVVALDGDGSLLLSIGALGAVAHKDPPNLLVIVLDNEAYEATGGQPTATRYGADLEQIARGFGVRATWTSRTIPELRDAVEAARGSGQCGFVVAKVAVGPTAEVQGAPRSTLDGVETKYRFARYIERRYGRVVLKPPTESPAGVPRVRVS